MTPLLGVRVQAFRQQYGQLLETHHWDLVSEVNSALQDVSKLMIDPSYLTAASLTDCCWQFITERKTDFNPELKFEADTEALLQRLEANVEKFITAPEATTIGKESSITNDLQAKLTASSQEIAKLKATYKGKIANLKATLAASSQEIAKLTATSEEENTKLHATIENLKEDLKSVTMQHSPLESWPESDEANWLTSCCCCPLYSFCWPLVGGIQVDTIKKIYNKEDPIRDCETCLLPTCMCCIGAAINRTRIATKVGIDTCFLANMIFYFCGCGTVYLLMQEREVGKVYEMQQKGGRGDY